MVAALVAAIILKPLQASLAIAVLHGAARATGFSTP